ncbi:MAG: ATP-binding protein [Bradyrhizobium sp.]|jgi:signal transduction histidine kinase|uniref:sensor histidine kinase n=1 Tax=Bradyrhizobium sp. TaxID=376 RepID=UPI003BDC1BD1
MSRGGSNSSTFWILREFAACLRLCQLMSTAVTPLAAAGAGSAEKGRATKLRTTFLMACAGLALSIACCVQASAATRHVVLLFDERVELPGLSLLDKELASTLRANSTERVEIYREAMDLSRFSSYSYKTVLRDRLPPNNEIHFREETAWERYWWQIALVGAIVLIQAGLISILLHEHHQRRLAEVRVRQRMADLAHLNRFSTAGELTASISHEINQPLGSILTNAEAARAILKSPHPDLKELNEIVDDILQDDRRASEVIRRMRSLLKKAPFEPKKIDFNDLVREAIDFLSALAVARKVKLSRSILPNALPIVGDRIQLQQAILNLVINAIDAMSETVGENRIVSLRTSRFENFAELSISDRGPGIPADKLKEVFQPFFTTKAEGMGMGLPIAQTIVEAHNGEILAANELGAGAVFRIRLPIIPYSVAPAQPALG